MRKLFAILVLVTIFIVAGAWREIIFVNINAQIYLHNNPDEGSWVVPYLSRLEQISVTNLLNLKWILTVFFTVIHYLLSLYFFIKISPHKSAKKWLNYSYLVLFCFSGLLYLFGYLADSESGYLIARSVMGALQSPLILMILIPATFLQKAGG